MQGLAVHLRKGTIPQSDCGIKHYEKLFQSEPNILKMLNLQNAEDIYVEHAHIVERMIEEKKEKEFNAIKGLD